MAQIVLDAPASPRHRGAGASPAAPAQPVIPPPAATPTTVHLAFDRDANSASAMARRIAQVRAEHGGDVRVLVEVEVVLAEDAAAAARKRSQLELLDALVGLAWSPSSVRVVTTADRVEEESGRLAGRLGADGVVLLPVGRSRA